MERLAIFCAFLAVSLASPVVPNQQPFQPNNPIPSPLSQGQAPIDCVYTPWTPFTECTESCGQTGTKSRTRSIVNHASNGGKACDPSLLEEWQPCFTPCSVDCVMEEWGPWSVCHVRGGQQCGVGRRGRTRGVLVQPQNGGRQCEDREEWETCDAGPCPQDCALGFWSPWSQCPSCGQAERNRNRQIIIQAAFGGRQCDTSNMNEVEACQISPCPVDCVMGQWGPYTPCQSNNGQTCGQGFRSRQRSMIVQPRFGGRECEQAQQSEQCDLGPCPVDCIMSQWGPYTPCQSNNGQTCGQGLRSRQRSIVVQPRYGGRQCEQAQQSEQCDLGPCPVDCVMSQWGPYSSCQSNNGQTCGQGLRSRQRSIIVQPRFGGRQCEQAQQSEQCDLGPCPVDCVMSQWGPYSSCQSTTGQTCGQGRRSRQRSIIVQPRFGGRQCGQADQSEQCDLGPCPVDCVMSQWGPYGDCSAQCGAGTQTRFRSILVPAQHNGRPCERTEDTKICQSKPCFDPPSCVGRPTEFYINPSEPCSPNFWKCINEVTHFKVCPDGLMFNIQNFRCQPRSQVPACF